MKTAIRMSSWGVHTASAMILSAAVLLPTLSYAQDKSDIRVGVVLRIGREEGFKMKQMVQVMIDEQNKAGGINGRQIKTFTYNEDCVPNLGVEAVTRTIEQDKVHVILGPTCSGVTLATVPISAKLETPSITGQSTASAITQMGSAWVFRTSVPDRYQAVALANFVTGDLGKKRVAVLYETDAMGTGFSGDFIAQLKKNGVELVAIERSATGDTDFRPQLIKIKSQNPDVLATFVHEAESARSMTQARDIGLPSSVPRVGSSTLSSKEFPTLAGSVANNVYFTSTFNPFDPRKDIQEYAKMIFTNYNLYPDQNYSQTTDAVNVLFEALKSADIKGTDESLKDDRRKIRDALAQVKNFKGLAGVSTFCADPTPECRDGNKDVRILQYEGGGAEAKIKTIK
jgi:branched-chain amino acid transport system substrate-binding protein